MSLKKKTKRTLYLLLPPVLIYGFQGLRRMRSRAAARRYSRRSSTLKVNIGAGPCRGSGDWITLDSLKGCDVRWDLRYGLPFADESVDALHASHVLEHFPYGDICNLLAEMLRVLKPAGVLTVAVPDGRSFINAYVSGKPLPEEHVLHEPAFNRTTPIDAVNYIAYMVGHHRYLFDEDNLLFVLQDSGFRNVRSRKFIPGLDTAAFRHESIYARAEK